MFFLTTLRARAATGGFIYIGQREGRYANQGTLGLGWGHGGVGCGGVGGVGLGLSMVLGLRLRMGWGWGGMGCGGGWGGVWVVWGWVCDTIPTIPYHTGVACFLPSRCVEKPRPQPDVAISVVGPYGPLGLFVVAALLGLPTLGGGT